MISPDLKLSVLKLDTIFKSNFCHFENVYRKKSKSLTLNISEWVTMNNDVI